MTEITHITPTEFARRWPTAGSRNEVVLLDVREPDELACAALPSVKHIPMGQVPDRLSELNADDTIVVMCHGGMRSLRVAQFLVTRGFPNVLNLAGGIDAWSREVDSTIPRY